MEKPLTPPPRIRVTSIHQISPKVAHIGVSNFIGDFQARSTSVQGGNTAVIVQLQNLKDALKELKDALKKEKTGRKVEEKKEKKEKRQRLGMPSSTRSLSSFNDILRIIIQINMYTKHHGTYSALSNVDELLSDRTQTIPTGPQSSKLYMLTRQILYIAIKCIFVRFGHNENYLKDSSEWTASSSSFRRDLIGYQDPVTGCK